MSSSAAAGGLVQRMFQLKSDPLTGKSEWVVIEEEEEDDIGHQTTPKALLATTSYLDMLNDSRRNRAYCLAIEKAITKPCHVLDIGAGTGLLSMMAARAIGLSDSNGSSCSKGMVTACESYLPMVKLMRKVLRANGMDGKIRVLNKRSDELEVGLDIPSRADVLVSEILDSELLGEGLIPTLQHAHDKLLVENPHTVPYRATTYGQLVECTYLWEMHDLVHREVDASDGIHLVPSGMADLLAVKKQQFAMHCNAIKDEIKLLSEPFKVFDFEFWRRPDSFREAELNIKATNDGTVHAIISWWLLQLDSEGTIFYSTGPNWIPCPNVKDLKSSFLSSGDWCDHWKQSVWFTPGSGLPIFKDKEVQLCAAHTETSISYELKISCDETEAANLDLHTQDCQIVLLPERIALYGDSGWRDLMLNAIKKAKLSLTFGLEKPSYVLNHKHPLELHQKVDLLCLVADDSIFLTVAITHLSKTSRVIPLFPGLGKKGAQYLQKASTANSYTMDRIEFIRKKDLQLNLQGSLQRKINLFIAEPFYYGNDNVLPWQNLRFWRERTLLDPILSEDVLIMPCRGLLKACAMYLPDLWKSRCCLKEIEGFDHSTVNTTLGGCGGLPVTEDSPFLPYFIWQCGETKILSEMTTVLEFDFSKPVSPCSGKAKAQFRESGTCHGFVLWIDWAMDMDDNTLLSTGPDKRHWKQAVKLLNEPVEVGKGDLFCTELEAFFDPSNGELVLNHAFLTNQR
ncbi:protein arginine methyltransferase 7 [Perilla frutescens var. hirtella]|uniref:Protein arginine methyltransferase 7 n=1 Tax=Perilla frutescens var. hirtella TaxID=608512 RepID=A0AAD4P144_PERFH|nr:protein arginine methyltransferase 7 [Perilla frutescens var. hirtella]